MRTARNTLAAAAMIGLSLMAGCASPYYQIKDPSTGKIYYSRDYATKDGATTLTDAKSKAEVSIQNSEITKLTEEQYTAGLLGAGTPSK